VRLLTAGAPPAAVTIELIERGLGWNVTHIYGLTETSPFILICEELPEHRKLPLAERAIVKARQGVELVTSGEIRVLDASGLGVPSDGQTLGEICVRGNVVMKGYFRDAAETDKAIVDGWFHTGDAAVVHSDGYVEIRDRFKDVIISGRKHFVCGGRKRVASSRRGAGGLGRRHAAPEMGRSCACVRRAASRQNRHGSRNRPIRA
jgi:fatty-acyl-CoA synthase